MSISTIELAQTREIVTRILDGLQLDAYLFEVEPSEDQWEVRVECAVEGGWERVTLTAAKEDLLQAVDDSKVRRSLLEDWRETLSACLIKGQQPAT